MCIDQPETLPNNQEEEHQDVGFENLPLSDEEDHTADQKMLEQLENNASGPASLDARSVYVGNVDYGTTPKELQEHFKNCGVINRITIMIDRYSGYPRGLENFRHILRFRFAYIEFREEAGMNQALNLHNSVFRDRHIKVCPKRKNLPGLTPQHHTFAAKEPFGNRVRLSRYRGKNFKRGFSAFVKFRRPLT